MKNRSTLVLTKRKRVELANWYKYERSRLKSIIRFSFIEQCRRPTLMARFNLRYRLRPDIRRPQFFEVSENRGSSAPRQAIDNSIEF